MSHHESTKPPSSTLIPQSVSIVIPTRAQPGSEKGKDSFVVRAIKSLIAKTTYPHFEIVLVIDRDADSQVLKQLKEIAGTRLKLVPWEQPFNFSQKMNVGVVHSSGEFVLLLNDDVEVISPDWIQEMLAALSEPDAGMSGCMLYFEDDTIQHAGHAYYKGSPTHIGIGLPRGSAGPDNKFLITREVAGVTAACALMPRLVFDQVGGFSALFPGNYNDVDLSMKVRSQGYRIYWTPAAELYHFESKSRDAKVYKSEIKAIQKRWKLQLHDHSLWPEHPHAAS